MPTARRCQSPPRRSYIDGMMNVLTPKYLTDPALLVADIRAATTTDEETQEFFQVVHAAYLAFAQQEHCPNNAAERFAQAAGIEPDASAVQAGVFAAEDLEPKL